RLRANDIDEMLLSGEHVTRPRRIEINAFASRIPALIPFPPIIFPLPTVPPDALAMTKISWNLVGSSHQLTCQFRRIIVKEDDIDILLIFYICNYGRDR
ncbi:hypothetical protein ALC60_04114, partial [Trachymyrmex zeteki]